MKTEKPVMLITGTRTGIGNLLARHYAANGYFVIGCSRSALDFDLENYRHFTVDIGNETRLREMFGFLRTNYGRLDVLINNAGLSSANLGLLMNSDHVGSVIHTNVVGSIMVSLAAAKLMMKNRFGRIINISSIHVPLATPGTSLYGATKSGLEQFSRVLAKEVGSHGITVNTLGLSFVKKSGMVESLRDEDIRKVSDQLTLDAFIDIRDVVFCIDFFASRNAGVITGQTLYTSGP